MKKQFVADLSIGDVVDDIFVISRINLSDYDGGNYLRLRFADRTGKISGVMWSKAEEIYQQIKAGDPANVQGRIELYRGDLQLKAGAISPVSPATEIDPADFLPTSRFSPERLRERLAERVAEIEDESCRHLLEALLADEEMMEKFSRVPGGKTWHHAHIGGLLEHTLSVVAVCRAVAPYYPQVNVDLLVTGAIFHDLGKTRELSYRFAFDYTTEGRLVGHTVMGYDLLQNYANKIDGFPPDTLMYLKHIILSHHGDTDRSPVLPMIPEAFLLHYVENMDAQMAAVANEMDKVRDMGREWTEYVALLKRPLFIGMNSKEDPSEPEDQPAEPNGYSP